MPLKTIINIIEFCKDQIKKINTYPGDLVLFPSLLPHRVILFNNKAERISIAFDIVPR